jgi:ribose transport system substrate-binding protein
MRLTIGYGKSYTTSKQRKTPLRRARMVGVFAAAAVVSFAAYAAAVDIDVGNDMKVPVDPSQPLKIAMFMPALNTSYLQANIKGAQDEAAKVGASVSVFDAKFDPMNQLNQMQNAIQTKQYNAFLVFPIAGQVLCKVATEEAPKAGILVSAYHFSFCNTTFEAGDKQWAPGTLQYVGGSSSYPVFLQYLTEIVKDNPGPQKVGILTGLELADDTLRIKRVVDDLKAKFPQFQVVDNQHTDYTIPDAQKHAQNMIQSHPDIGIIITTYSNITRAAVNALEQAGKLGSIKIYDFGGTSWSKKAIEAGQVVATVPFYAYTSGAVAVRNLALAHQGKQVPHYIPNDGGPADAPIIIDKSNVDKFTPESD